MESDRNQQSDLHLLEPIVHVEVETPSGVVGRIQGDLSARRGLLLGSEPRQIPP